MGKLTKWQKWNKNGTVSIICCILGLAVPPLWTLGFERVRLNPKIDSMKEDMSIMKETLKNFDDYYISKDSEGINIIVGINTNLQGNHVKCFRNNPIPILSIGKHIILTNHLDNFYPTLKLLVTEEIDRDDDISEAEIFISKEAAERLGLSKKMKQGIYKMKIKECQ